MIQPYRTKELSLAPLFAAPATNVTPTRAVCYVLAAWQLRLSQFVVRLLVHFSLLAPPTPFAATASLFPFAVTDGDFCRVSLALL